MIILEGPDNAGKSTLLQQMLAEEPGLRLLHRDRYKPGESIALSYFRALLPADGDRARHGFSVADRLIASECIYGSLFRNGCRLTLAEHHALEQLLVSYSARVVHCDVSHATLRKTWGEREQLYQCDPAVISDAYRERLRDVFPALAVHRYNWQAFNSEDQRSLILADHTSTMVHRRPALDWWSAVPYGIGCLVQPAVMLVGEELSPRAQVPVPFTGGPAGEFLAWSLARVFYVHPRLRTQLYTTNAIKNGNEKDVAILREEVRFLQPDLIIALGRTAEKYLEAIDAKFTALPHPQFWRRFNWKRKHEYPNMILQAMGSVLRPLAKGTPLYTHQEEA